MSDIKKPSIENIRFTLKTVREALKIAEDRRRSTEEAEIARAALEKLDKES